MVWTHDGVKAITVCGGQRLLAHEGIVGLAIYTVGVFLLRRIGPSAVS